MTASDLGGVFAESRRQGDEVILLVDQNLANVLGDRVFPHRLTLPHSFAV